jgi:CRP-like cAMP-binding protein
MINKNHELAGFLETFLPDTRKDLEIIASAFERKTFREGEQLFHSGRICREMFFICTGILRIVTLNEKGNQVIHYFLKPNAFCTILNSFTNGLVAAESIEAACDTEVLVINKSRLLLLYQEFPFLENLIKSITQQALLDKIAMRNGYMGFDSATRYQLFLDRQPEIARQVQLGDIASYLGITPQSLSRIRKQLK